MECNRDEWMLRMGSCPCKQSRLPIARFHSNPSGKCLAGRSAALRRLPIARAIGCAPRLAYHPGMGLVRLQKDFEQALATCTACGETPSQGRFAEFCQPLAGAQPLAVVSSATALRASSAASITAGKANSHPVSHAPAQRLTKSCCGCSARKVEMPDTSSDITPENLFNIFSGIALECNRDEWMLRIRRMGS